MEKRKLGKQGPNVSALGLGCFGMSHAYGKRSETESIKTLHRAIDLGCTFLDTADEYGGGSNELLLGEALQGRRPQVILATKFGFVWDNQGNTVGLNATPSYIHQACEASLKRLKTDYIDLYYLHRVDPNVPIEETVSAMAKLVIQGKVHYLGLSEASAETIRRANAIHPITALQSEFSLWWREPRRDVIPVCRELGIGFVAFSPLGRGFFSSQVSSETLGNRDFRKSLPRFQPENLQVNFVPLEHLKELSNAKQCSSSQLALAWVLAQGKDIVAIPGTTAVPHLEENLGALTVPLTPDELLRIDAILSSNSFAGARYSEASVFAPALKL